MSESVLVAVNDAVATITFNRPGSLNSASLEFKTALLGALQRVSDDSGVRAVILTGAGSAFSAGQDLAEHAALLEAGDPAPLTTVTEHFNPIARAILGMPKPVIAAVNGVAAGAGASFALAADFRVMAESASFLLAFAGVGLSLDSGASWLLPRLIGHARASALALLAERVTAEQALEMGMVNAVVPDDRVLPAAAELATRLAAGPTLAYAAIKESLIYAETSTFDEALAKEAELQAALGGTADHHNGTAAFLAKQRPTFTGK
ncbi:MAG TPA: enoyl-CoA hydratase-related protein [Mycobacteriales bacterium]|nr:enoyl-CoA hydratase-related protein [Mycobacteriales bacterium]